MASDRPADADLTAGHGVPTCAGLRTPGGGDRMTRPASWACGDTARDTKETPEVRRAMLLTLREPVHVTVMAFFWTQATALGSFLTVSQPDMRLALMGTILPIGFCGYVVSRWQAFPGFAACFIHGHPQMRTHVVGRSRELTPAAKQSAVIELWSGTSARHPSSWARARPAEEGE